MTKIDLKLALLSTLITLGSAAHATETFTQESIDSESQKLTVNNGYTQIVIDTTHEQKKPLDTIITMELPENIINVGQAINYVLQNSGYHLKDLPLTDLETVHLFTLTPPLSHRRFYQSTVIQIIQTLVGQAYETNVDHVNREIEILPLV